MKLCQARVGELMAATSFGRARLEDVSANVHETLTTTERQVQTNTTRTSSRSSKSETQAVDAGHDVGVAGESESRKRAPAIQGMLTKPEKKQLGTKQLQK